MNKKIDLYINGCYMCTSTRYAKCKDFRNKVLEDGFIVWQGIRKERYNLKPTDTIKCSFKKM